MSRRLHSKNQISGFTIVELLVVIVVIAILAAIAIVAYNGITTRAVETSMQSDLRTASQTLELDNTRNGSYPANASSANGGLGLGVSNGSTLGYTLKSYGYCISATNPRSSKTFVIKSSTNQISEGSCAAIVSTLAGTGVSGTADGSSTTAQFESLAGVAVDGAGNVYVTDRHRVRKISASGDVSTLAGSSTSGNTDGAGSAARFYFPRGLVVDNNGLIYVADALNNRIRTVTQGGTVNTLAGSTAGYLNGTGTGARFFDPTSLAMNAQGDFYVVDNTNNRIRTLTSLGSVGFFAGSTTGYTDGNAASAQFNFPWGIAIGPSGTIYVVDNGNFRIRTISPAGTVGTLRDSNGSEIYISGIRGIAIDSAGTIYFTDPYNRRIRSVTPDGTLGVLAGSGVSGYADGEAGVAQFREPWDIAIGKDGALYVTDKSDYRVRKIIP